MDKITEFHRLESSRLKRGAQARTTNRSNRITSPGGGLSTTGPGGRPEWPEAQVHPCLRLAAGSSPG